MSPQPFAKRTVAVTGASGTLGQALLKELHSQGASLLALTSGEEQLDLHDADGKGIALEQVRWRCGEEQALRGVLERCDVLVVNHGFNSHSDRSPAAVVRSLEVNALSSWRLLELFAEIARNDRTDRQPRELWMNTSEAEIQTAVSPLYEISKRLQGQLLSLRSLDLASPKLRLRRLVLGPFRSTLNPIGLMSASFVAREIVRQVKWDWGLVIVTPNPLTYLLMPVNTLSRWLYFRMFSQPDPDS